MTLRLYNSERWLRYQYLVLRKSPQEIAKEAGCSLATVYNKLKEYGFIR